MQIDGFARLWGSLFTATVILVQASNCLRPVERTGELAGSVVDSDGRPVPGARVVLKLRYAPETTIAKAETSADGRFRIGPIAPFHREQLLVFARGFGSEHREDVSIFPDAINEVRIVVAAGRTVEGRILDADGQPAANVPVACSTSRYVTGRYLIESIGPEEHLTTNADGEFRVENVPVCRFSVHVNLPDFRSGGMVAAIPPGSGALALSTVQLTPDVPISGVVHDSHGKPLEKIPVTTNFAESPTALTDAAGRFVLRGFRAELIPQVAVVVSTSDFAFRRVDAADHPSAVEITLDPQRWISGGVVDAETGEPIAIKRLILCSFTRRPNGEIDRGNCRPIPFDQPHKGQFRLAYREPANIHITVQAQGYEDAEANLDARKTYENIEGVVIKARRNGSPLAGDSIPVARITGTLTRAGRPVTSAWVSAVRQRTERKYPYVDVQRGRTVRRESQVFPSAIASPTGAFSLDLRNEGTWYVFVEEPNRAPTILGPFEMKMSETRKLDVSLVDGGAASGRVRGIPAESAGAWWVVSFDQIGWRAEARIAPDGTFLFDRLPIGKFALKVGHDAYHDPENPDQPTAAEKERVVDPWHGATLVQILPGQTTANVLLDAPSSLP